MKIHEVDIAKTEPDQNGGYDLLVDMNQVGIPEDQSPPVEIHIEGERFFQSGLCDDEGQQYWSYWNDGAPAVNLKLHLS
jgi:hypothetical protein